MNHCHLITSLHIRKVIISGRHLSTLSTFDSLPTLRNLLYLINLRKNLLIDPLLFQPSSGHPSSIHLLETQENTLRRLLITFTLPYYIGVEKKENSIVLYPLANRCDAANTDGQNSTRCDLMRLYDF